MTESQIGQLYSLAAALSWSIGLIFFRLSGEQLRPLPLNLFKDVVALLLLIATLSIAVAVQADGAEVLRSFRRNDLLILAASGILGIGLADTIFFHGLRQIGVGLASIVDCMYSPFVLLFSALLLGERIGAMHYVGGGLILCGVAISAGRPLARDRTGGQIAMGIGATVLAVAMMAFGIVIAKPSLERIPVLWATTIRLAAGTAFLALLAIALRSGGETARAFRPSRVWRYSVPGAIIGTYLCLIVWISGFKYTHAAVAALLNQMSVIFALLLASVFLREPLNPRKAAAVVLALAGMAVITFGAAAWEVLTGAQPA